MAKLLREATGTALVVSAGLAAAVLSAAVFAPSRVLSSAC
jgi:hypothetical protein